MCLYNFFYYNTFLNSIIIILNPIDCNHYLKFLKQKKNIFYYIYRIKNKIEKKIYLNFCRIFLNSLLKILINIKCFLSPKAEIKFLFYLLYFISFYKTQNTFLIIVFTKIFLKINHKKNKTLFYLLYIYIDNVRQSFFFLFK